MFIDEAHIEVVGGNGGRGCVAFRREKYVPKGGPAGGDGGRGGSVVLHATTQLQTLMDIQHQGVYSAGNGRPGEGSNKTGRSGDDLVIDVPAGTIIYDDDSGALLCDLCEEDQRFVVARGGKGGRGNRAFATATNRAPREFEDGEEGLRRKIYLELKLIADVGLIGLPNAGKSTLLSTVSDARPKIAGYPFTTLAPNLGVSRVGEFQRVVLADLPGLIEGAHEGAGLGDEFLRHIERTRLLVHLVDVSPYAMAPPDEAYVTIRNELESHSEALARKPEIVVGSKTDTGDCAEGIAALERVCGGEVLTISSATRQGLDALMAAIVRRLEECS